MRRIRKVVSYACTSCFRLFPSSKDARAHASSAHPARATKKASPGRPRSTQTGNILKAIGSGAKTAEAISKKTSIPLERVHSLLSYHRRRGNVKGFTGELSLTRDGKKIAS